jgi:hypothetical protein
MKVLLIITGALAILIFLVWLGLQIKPAPFSPYPEQTPLLKTVSPDAGLDDGMFGNLHIKNGDIILHSPYLNE